VLRLYNIIKSPKNLKICVFRLNLFFCFFWCRLISRSFTIEILWEHMHILARIILSSYPLSPIRDIFDLFYLNILNKKHSIVYAPAVYQCISHTTCMMITYPFVPENRNCYFYFSGVKKCCFYVRMQTRRNTIVLCMIRFSLCCLSVFINKMIDIYLRA